jgi:TM2 domain-containing membrane protein YozV
VASIDWLPGLALERDIARLMVEQEEYGVYFDEGKARYYIALLERMKDEEEAIVRPFLCWSLIINETKKGGEYNWVKKIYLANGRYSSQVTNLFDDPTIVEGEFSRISFEEPSISKRKSIINQLLRLGWKPTVFTEKGFPKLTDGGEPVASLEEVGPFGKALSNWYIYGHRQSQISGFLPHIRKDGRISAQINSCGTNTFRAKHRVVANIPRPTSIFGKEMRSLFRVRDGRCWVGADVSGLELRMLAHHMGDPEYIELVLHGDIHTHNQLLAGLPTRDAAKTFIYAWLYGAGSTKIGSIVGGGSRQGKILIDNFMEGLPSVAILINKVKSFAEKRGYVPSIDGRKIYVRKFLGKVLVHTALNCLLQANGSIVTKKSIAIAAERIKELGLDAHPMIFYHDETAWDCDPSCAEEVGKILIDSMRLAGEYYNLKIPITGEYVIGKDWSTH